MGKKEGKIDSKNTAADFETAAPDTAEVQAGGFPTWLDLVAMIVIFLLATLVGGSCMLIMKRVAPGMEQELVNVVTYGVQFVLAIGGVWVYRAARGASGSPFRFAFKWYNSSLVLLGIVLIAAVSIAIEPLVNAFPEHWFERLNAAIGRGGWAILMTVVLAPVFEEMLFRGLILESMRRKWGASAAIVVSAALFGLVHAPILPQMLNAFVMGVILGYIYVLTDSLLSVIVIHAVNNGLAYMLLEITGDQATDVRAMLGNDTVWWIVYAASLVVSVAALVSMAVIATDRMRKRAEIAAVFNEASAEEKEEETLPSEEGENNNKE